MIAPLRCVRISPGVGVRTIAKVPLRRGEVDTEFDQDELAKLLDQQPFNLAVANLYKTRFNGVPGVVYAAGVRHAYNLAEAFRAEGIKAQGVSGETPKRELVEILARYERGDIDVLINAQLLAEGWNSPRATVCVHLAPTASKRIYQQRVGRVTRRHPGKEAGLVVDFVHPATKHDDPVVTLHSLLDRDVYRGGAIVVGPVRRGRGRRMRVERRVLPVCAEEERRFQVFERELWRIAVEHLDYGEQHLWAALAGARVAPNGWRRARAMLHFDRTGELKSRFLITAVKRNKNAQLRLRALTDIAALRDPDAFDAAIDIIGGWPREERKEATKIMLRALVERRIGRRDQANAWIWRLAEYTRDVHEEYAVQRWPETKRLLGLLVNSAGGAHARNARRLIHAARKQDRRLAAALLAAALAHTPEAEEALRGARTRMARKPPALARELLRNFPKRRARNARRRRKGAKGTSNGSTPHAQPTAAAERAHGEAQPEAALTSATASPSSAGAPRSELADELRRDVRDSLDQHPAEPLLAKRLQMHLAGGDAVRPPSRARRAAVPCRRSPRRARVPAAHRCPPHPTRSRGRAARRARATPRASSAPARRAAARAPAAAGRASARCRFAAGRASRRAGRRLRPRARSLPDAARRQLIEAHGDVQPDPEHRPALLPACAPEGVPSRVRAALDEDAGELRQSALRRGQSTTMSLGHLICACAPTTSHTATPRRAAAAAAARHAAAATSAARCPPAPTSAALAPAPGGLLGGGHERPVRRARDRQLAGALVGRAGAAQVHARPAEAHAGRTVSSSSATAPSSSAAEPRLTASATIRVASS